MTQRAIEDGLFLIVQCPHCLQYLIVAKKEVNCKIFRHAVFKTNFKQIDPHSKKEICDTLAQKQAVYGCSKAFRLVAKADGFYPEKCDYI